MSNKRRLRKNTKEQAIRQELEERRLREEYNQRQPGWVVISQILPDGRVLMFPVEKMVFSWWKGPGHEDEGMGQFQREVVVTPEVLESMADHIHGTRSGLIIPGPSMGLAGSIE